MGKQLSIFMENKPGKINRITGILQKEEINLKAMTIADSGTFGIVKIMTDNNKKAFNVLKKDNFLVSYQDVVVVEIQDKVGAFHYVAKILEDGKINIEDAYGFIIEADKKAVLILKVAEPKKVETLLKKQGYKLIEDF